MRKKSQITVYVIIGLIFVFMLLFALYLRERAFTGNLDTVSAETQFPTMSINTQAYIRNCINSALKEHMATTGLTEDTIPEYEASVKYSVEGCTNDLFGRLEEQNYEITSGEPSVFIELYEETILVEVVYDTPILMKKDNKKTEYEHFLETFEKTNWVEIPGGVTEQETQVASPDGRAKLIIPEGVELTDEDGDPVEEISIKVKGKTEDGLNNGVVIGNLIFDGQPDGLTFSEPVQIIIEIRPEDIPEGMDITKVAIATWDPVYQVWEGRASTYQDNTIISTIEHFSPQAATICQNYYYFTPQMNTFDMVFVHRYQVPDAPFAYDEQYWLTLPPGSESNQIGSKYNLGFFKDYYTDYDGTVPIQYGYFTEDPLTHEGAFYDCVEDNDCYVKDGDYVLPAEGDEITECSSFNIDDTMQITQGSLSDLDPECYGKYVGNSCGEGMICKKGNNVIVEDGLGTVVQSGSACKCEEKTSGNCPAESDDYGFGYYDYMCVGGIRQGSVEQPVHCVEVLGNGDGCVMDANVYEVYSTGDFCSIIQSVPGDNVETLDNGRLVKIATGTNTLICALGVQYVNLDRNAGAFCGLRYVVQGEGVGYWSERDNYIVT